MSDATFQREPLTEGATIIPERVEGDIFTPFLPAYGDKRIMLLVSARDRSDFDRLPGGPSDETVEVEDLLSGTMFEVRRANCGAGCFCAAAIVS
jgi:hypothetical protein